MNNHYAAVEDCKRAIDMDPAYGKAYGRMGLAYACVDKHKEAIECFKKAIELEPENESYKSNMKLAQDKLSAAGGISTGPQPGGFPGKLSILTKHQLISEGIFQSFHLHQKTNENIFVFLP